jgi:hypothetical protein
MLKEPFRRETEQLRAAITNGDDKSRGCKYVEHPTTKEDLDALYDHLFERKPMPPRRHPVDPETERMLSDLYGRIVKDQEERRRNART